MNTEERIEKLKELWNDGWYLEDAVEEIADHLSEDEFKPKIVDTIEEHESRWMIHTLDIAEIDEGVYVGVRWERGKTEMQENIFDDKHVYLLERVEKVVTTVDWNDKKKL
ncbi:hypothetical protein SEA_WARPY_127 [Streptomyces phage Warpy]|uniref:Uncharacterized protein n=1 Tax=Streptomyces phage Warpy TaxID=2015805 RepID=A0A221SB29_9CAUD|nr:hypothetical protein SEA_WARPY_127 [Streptomyces phage Warpy]